MVRQRGLPGIAGGGRGLAVREGGRILTAERGHRRTGRAESHLHVVLAADQRRDPHVEQPVLQVPEVVPAQGRVVDEVQRAAAVGRRARVHLGRVPGTAPGEVGEERIQVTGEVGVHVHSLAGPGRESDPGTGHGTGCSRARHPAGVTDGLPPCRVILSS
jgi:hypothetical protein